MIQFQAALHHTNAALSVYGDGDTKITLSCDASQLAEVLKLLTMRGQVFQVSVEPIDASHGDADNSDEAAPQLEVQALPSPTAPSVRVAR